MIKQLFSEITDWLKRPYPIITNPGVKLLYILCFGIFITLFIIFFKPFGFYSISLPHLYYYGAAFGITSAVSLSVASYILPWAFPGFFSGYKWNIGRQICFMIIFFIIFTFSNWTFYYVSNIREITGFGPVSIIGISIALGIFPSLLYILVIERKYLKASQSVISGVYKAKELEMVCDIEFCSSNNNLKYLFKSADINCIQGCGNYFIVYYESDGLVRQQIIRNTLKLAENKLDEKQFIRCHKSYIVNIKKIISVKGNIKDMKLITSNLNLDIPVSRNLPKNKFRLLISKTTDQNVFRLN